MNGPWHTLIEFVGGPLCGEKHTFVLPLGGDYKVPVQQAAGFSHYEGTRHVYRLKPWRGRTIYFYEGTQA